MKLPKQMNVGKSELSLFERGIEAKRRNGLFPSSH
jgi:hypothetical protein